MLSREDLLAMVATEEQRLGVGSPEFIRQHNEVMAMIERAKSKSSCQCTTPSKSGNPSVQ